jgi:prepilin-type N-terminal cleavage/methylation domain-containing protein
MDAMKKSIPHLNLSNAGMTLMELLVATTLVGIVMIGTMSVDFAVHSMRKSTADSSGVALQTSATMLDISNTMAKAVGDGQDLGIRLDNPFATAANPSRVWFCARQDKDNDPNDYNDDEWVCYWKPAATTNVNIYKCTKPVTLGPGPCNLTNEVIGTTACELADCTNSRYLFTFYLENDSANREFFFDINLKSRAYPTKLHDTTKPMKNPEYKLSSHIAPMGHSY